MNRRRPRHWKAIAIGPEACSSGPATAFRRPRVPSWRGLRLNQIPDAHQVVQRGTQREQPSDAPHAPVARRPEEGHRLEPAEHLFDELALLLTDAIPRMARRPHIDRTAPLR